MAKGNNTKIENLATSWNGYTGERVEEFIKQEISNLQSTKVGYIFENSETEKVDFYSSENDYNEGKSPLGSIASKPLYTLYVKEDDSNKHTFLAGDENKNFTWYFKTVNNNEEKTLFAESVIVEYTFKNINNNTTKVVPLEIPSNNVTENEDFTTVTLDLNQYLSNGVTNITISVRGSVTKRTALLSRSITIILLEMTDVTNFSTPVVNSLVLGADVKCTLGTTYHMQYRFDNKEYVFNPAYDVIGTQTVDHPRYELPVGNLEDGKHVVEYRLFVTIDGQQQQYYTQTNRIEFIKGEGLVFDEPQILLYLTYYEGEDVITEDNNLIYNSVYQYIPFTIKYAVYNPFENTTILEFIDETENVENIAPVLSSIKNNEDKNVVFQFLDYGPKKMRIITKDSDNNTTNEGRVIYLNVKQSTLDIKICDKSLRIDFNSVSKTNDTNRDIWVSKVNSNGSEKIYNAYFNEEFNWSQGWTKNGLVISNNSEVSFDYCPFPKQEKGVSDEVAIEYIGGKIGYTLEIEFMTQNVTDENAIVCDMIDENKGKCGLLIKGTEIKFTTPNGNQVSSRFKDGEVNRAAIVVRPFYNANNEFKGLIELYMNGIICNVTTYNDSDAFEATELNDENRYVSKRLKFKGAKGADIIVKQIRAYNDALSSDEIVDNYILFKQDSSEMLTLYEDNKVLDGGNVSIQSVINKGDIPVLIFVGRTVGGELASGDGNDNGDEEYVAGDIASKSTYWYETLEKTSDKNETIDMDVIYYNPMDTRKNFKFVKAYIRPQGTSSMLYPKKNYRIYTQKNKDTRCFFPILDENGNMVTELDLNDMLKSNFGENEKDRIYEKWRGKNNYKKRKYSFKDGAQPVKCWCLKADFAETSSSHNTGVAKLWGDTLVNTSIKLGDEDSYVLRTNAQVAAKNIGYKYDVRTTIDGFPIVVFGAQSYSGPFTFLGKYNFNNDKSTESVFGFCDIDNENKITDDTFDYDTNTSGTTAHTLDWQLDKYMTCIETLDNGNALANFSTLENFDDNVDYDEKTGLDVKGWEKAFELRYPEKPEAPAPSDYKNDKGEWIDKEQYEKDKEKYLTTDLRNWENEHIKPLRHFAKWLLSTRWCDVNGEPLYGELQSVAESGMEHDESGNVLTSVNEIIAYRQRKFSTEKWDHLDVWKMAAYYVYVMRFGAVDQVVKNTMLTSEGPFAFDDLGNKYGLLDMTDIESENYGRYFKWYYINYDNDTVMGVKNDGSLAFGPNISRSKKESDGNYSYAGWDSTLWNNFDTDDDFQKIVRMVDNGISNYLTYNRAKQMFDEEQVGAWCERIYNRDADYKYITPYTGGWQYDGKDESGKVPFSSKLFMLQGSRTAHRRWWLSKRFNLFDGKWNSGEFSNKFVEIKSNYAIIGSTFSAKAGANAYFGYQINKQTFNQGKKDGGTSFEYSAGETINWKLYKNIQIGDPIAIYGSADLMELNLQGISQNIQEMRFVFGNNEDNPNKLEILDISIPEDLLRGEYYYAAYSDYSRLQLDYSEELPININEDYWAELTFSENIEANESSVPFYRTIIYNEEIKENVTTFFAKKYGGIRNHSLTNDFTGFLNGLDKLQIFKMAGYAKVTSISLVANKFIETLDTRYSGVENIILPEGSRISDLRVSNSLNTLSFNRCNSIKLNNIIIDDKPLVDNKGINIQDIYSIDSEGLNHDNKFKDFILSWIKGGVGFKPTKSKTLHLNGIKWKGVSVKDIELLSTFVNEAYSCYISGEISMGSTNISRNEKKIIDDFQNNPNVDVKIRYPYPSILIDEVYDIVAGDDITITSTIFADEFSENENFSIRYVFVKEVGATDNPNVLHNINTGRYYEQLSVNSIRGGSVSLIPDVQNRKKVVISTEEKVYNSNTPVLIAAIFIYDGIEKFDVASFTIKDPTYASKGELVGQPSITINSQESETFHYSLKLYTNKGETPIGTITTDWVISGEGLDYIEDEGEVSENGLELYITTNKISPERAAKLTITINVNNHNDANKDFEVTKDVLILNENIIMTSQSNPVVMEICHRNGLAKNSDAMSKDEAINVMDISTYFSSINTDFSFEEFKFFNNVHSIKENAFKGSNITSITLHNNVTTIGDGAFENCKKLRNIVLPNTLTSIPERMFLNCSSLETLYLPDSVSVIKAKSFGGTNMEKILFNEEPSNTLKTIYVSQNSSLATIQNGAFDTTDIWEPDTTNKLNEISIPYRLSISVNYYDFLLSKNLNKIKLAENNDKLFLEKYFVRY